MFLVFLEVFARFFMYSCSISFRELKSAIKNQFFLFSIGGQINFLIEKKQKHGRILVPPGKNIGSACFLYMGGVGGGPPLPSMKIMVHL